MFLRVVESGTYSSPSKGAKPRGPTRVVYVIIGDSLEQSSKGHSTTTVLGGPSQLSRSLLGGERLTYDHPTDRHVQVRSRQAHDRGILVCGV